MRARVARWALATAAFALLVGAALAAARPGPAVLDVYAASSLGDAFAELERTFEARWPGSDVRVTVAGSQILALQIARGAPADVFASADPGHLDALRRAGRIGGPSVIARGELALITPLDDPAGIASYADLPRARRLVIGTEQVPIGAYTRELLGRLDGVTRPGFARDVLAGVVSLESNVRLVRAKVELGEADAAIVYASDVAGEARVRVVPIPEELNVPATYAMAAVEGGASELAERWLALVTSSQGQAILRAHGFLAPAEGGGRAEAPAARVDVEAPATGVDAPDSATGPRSAEPRARPVGTVGPASPLAPRAGRRRAS